MDHLKPLAIKFAAIAFAVFALFGLFANASLFNLFWISLLVTGISYIIGDLYILRKLGNVNATFTDFALSFISLLVLGDLFLGDNIPLITVSLLTSFFITCCEPFIHSYIVNHIPDDTREDLRTMNQLQTEFAEEMDANSIAENKDTDK